jgi:hypothetical protein
MRPSLLVRPAPLLAAIALLALPRPMLPLAQGATQQADEDIVLAQMQGSGIDATGQESLHVVYQQVDGNVSGRLSRFDASGSLVPVRANIHFIRDGIRVSLARSDERGRFQAVGLRPGVYSVIAVSREGFGVESILIRPFAEGAVRVQPTASEVGFARYTPLSLEMTLIPLDEFELLAGMLNEGVVDVPVAQPALPAGGGGGAFGGGRFGGARFGRGLGGLLGVAGLATGVTALATHERTQASPFAP